MDTKDVILELRTRKGLSQDQLAEQVCVTRQAVSRWENGETIPNTETLKLLSVFFDVSINTLLGSPRQLICQCCGMPLDDSTISKEPSGSFNEEYCKWCYRATLGTDPRGNLTRIDNALAQMPQRLEAVKNQLDNLYQQQAAAKEEIGKPFPFEDDLRVKSARLVELDTMLNIDSKGHAQPETVVAKSARPSVLDSLKRPVPPRSPEKKPKQHEEVR